MLDYCRDLDFHVKNAKVGNRRVGSVNNTQKHIIDGKNAFLFKFE